MTEHQKETAFLRRIIRFDDTDERRNLEERIAQVQRDARCIQRAAWLMALMAGLGAAGYGYSEILQENIATDRSWFAIKILCELGLASLIPLLVLVSLLMAYRRKLNLLREDCRRLVTKLLESHLGKLYIAPLRTGQFEAAGSDSLARQSSALNKTTSRS